MGPAAKSGDHGRSTGRKETIGPVPFSVPRAKKDRLDWLNRLSRACGYPIGEDALVDVQKTEKMKQNFFAMVKSKVNVVRLCWNHDRQDEVLRYFGKLQNLGTDKPVVLFSSKDEYYGAVLVQVGSVLRQPFMVWEVTEQDLCFALKDLSSGLCLERNFYNLQGKYVADGIYELTAWGDFSIHEE